MAIHLNKKALEQAERLIKAGEYESFDDNWQEEKPTADEVNHYLNTHYMEEYGLWFLGINQDISKDLKEHYEFPYGDLKTVQRCALEDTLENAKKGSHKEIVQAVERLLQLLEQKEKEDQQ